MAISQPNPFDHAAIIRVTRSDSAAVIADLVEALEGMLKHYGSATDAAGLHPDVFKRNTAQARAALYKARGE